MVFYFLYKICYNTLIKSIMQNMSKNNLYYYKCPESLGFLEITLDKLNKVKNCIFVSEKNDNKSEGKIDNTKYKESSESEVNEKDLPEEIKKALDDYFYKKKDLLSNLISREIMGTDFQKDIWRVILGTRFGETITYTDMAIKAGKSDAARAAGTACGKNPLALFIPCHRVVRKQNEDYGYSWGIDRKKWLLIFEGVNF